MPLLMLRLGIWTAYQITWRNSVVIFTRFWQRLNMWLGHVEWHQNFSKWDRRGVQKMIWTRRKSFGETFSISILDFVIAGLSARFNAAKQTNNALNLLWLYTDMSEDDIVNKSTNFAKIYSKDASEKKLPQKVLQLKSIHSSNFGSKTFDPFALLNKLANLNL